MIKPSNFIRRYRKEKALSQRALADLVGISQQHLQRLETGASPIRLETAMVICKELDLPVAAILPHIAKVIARQKPGTAFENSLR